MKPKLWLVGLLVALLLILAVPVAFAQGSSGDRLIIGRAFVLAAGQELNGNLVVLGGPVTLEERSLVRGDVALFGSSLSVAGTVQGNVAAFGGPVDLQDSAVIQGSLATFGGPLNRAPGAVVSGDSFSSLASPWSFGRQIPTPETPVLPAGRPVSASRGVLWSILAWELWTVGWALFLVLIGVVAIALAPRAMGRIASTAANETWVSFGMGLLTLVVGVLLGLILLIACCLGVLVWLALTVAWLVGWIAVGLWFGQRLLQALRMRDVSSIAEVALGVFLITFLSRVPWCIGFLFSLGVGSIGLGAVVLTRFGTQPYESDRPAGRISAPGDLPLAYVPASVDVTAPQEVAGTIEVSDPDEDSDSDIAPERT